MSTRGPIRETSRQAGSNYLRVSASFTLLLGSAQTLLIGINAAEQQPSLKPRRDITDLLTKSEAIDIYCISMAI